MARTDAERITFAEPQSAVAGLAESCRIGEHGLEYGFQVDWRTTDDVKDLGGRRLSLQRLAQLAGGRRLPFIRRLLLRHRFVELAGQQCDLLFVSALRSCLSRTAARRLYYSAPFRRPAARSINGHPFPRKGQALARPLCRCGPAPEWPWRCPLGSILHRAAAKVDGAYRDDCR